MTGAQCNRAARLSNIACSAFLSKYVKLAAKMARYNHTGSVINAAECFFLSQTKTKSLFMFTLFDLLLFLPNTCHL